MNGSNLALMQAVRGPVMLITLGTLLSIDHFGSYSFWRTWPALIIVFGLMKLLERVAVEPPPTGGGMS